MTFILILVAIIIGYFLIKYWIKFVNFIFNPMIKGLENMSSKITNTSIPKQNFRKDDSSNNFGLFNKSDYPKESSNEQFYFYRYNRMDGEWINIDDPICKIRIGEKSGYTFSGAQIFASKSGYLEHFKSENDLLIENDSLYKLHEAGKYESENSVKNHEFKHYFYAEEYRYTFEKWLKHDGEFVKKDDIIYQFKNSKYNLKLHKAEKDGFIDIYDPEKIISLNENELMYAIRNNDLERIERKYINHPNIITDDFTKLKKIEWLKVSSIKSISQGILSKSDDALIDLFFTLNYIDNNDFIFFQFNPKQIKLKINDKIHFLFENSEQIEFVVNSNPTLVRNKLNEKVIEIKSLITESELKLFANEKFKKWKISLLSLDKEILGGDIGGGKNYESKKNLKVVINKFSKEYINLVKKEIKDYKPIIVKEKTKPSSISNDTCYVYLMYDTSNGYYKIGISNNPKYRERTLQSEKPTIELIIAKKFPVRKIAESFEKSLHKTYSEKRIRGEWFELSDIDVKHIKESLK